MSDDADQGNPNLVACKDCGNGVSKKAEVCPHCGRRIRGSTTDQLAMVIFVLVLLGVLVECMGTITKR